MDGGYFPISPIDIGQCIVDVVLAHLWHLGYGSMSQFYIAFDSILHFVSFATTESIFLTVDLRSFCVRLMEKSSSTPSCWSWNIPYLELWKTPFDQVSGASSDILIIIAQFPAPQSVDTVMEQ